MRKILLPLMILFLSLTSYSQDLNLKPKKIIHQGKEYIAFDLKDGNKVKKYVELGKILEKDAAVFAKKETEWRNRTILWTSLGAAKGLKDGILISIIYVVLKNNNIINGI